ncbi:MAG: hypothetical protein AB7L90_21440 [Hyphomicrobiaceae bacterium]
MSDSTAIRHRDFREHHLLWLVVRHYLSADLLRELCTAAVDAVSDGKVSLADLCDEHLPVETSPLANWAVRLKPTKDGLQAYLQRFLQAVVWQGDQEPGIYEKDVTADELAAMKAVEAAIAVARADLSSIGRLAQMVEASPSIERLVKSAVRLKSSLDAGGSVETAFEPVIETDSPLVAILVKHLGDLCGDADRWDAALQLYDNANSLLAGCTAPSWFDLQKALASMLTQSRATALQYTKGPAAAKLALKELLDEISIDQDPVAVINATPDQMAVHYAVDAFDFQHDRRGVIAFAPQLLNAHALSNAFSRWTDRRFSDAYRWFWAVLRRQIALGSSTSSRQTKVYFGLSLIDGLEAKISDNRSPPDFEMAIRLLVESGQHEIIQKSTWRGEFVEAYVDTAGAQAAIALTGHHKGSESERTQVVLALFDKWLKALPSDRADAAGVMMRYMAAKAGGRPSTSHQHRDIRVDAREAIKSVGRERPEFRKIAISDVACSILATLEGGNMREIHEALDIARVYIDDLAHETLQQIAGWIADIVEATEGGAAPWPMARSALAFLSSPAVMQHAPPDLNFRKRIASVLLRLSLENESEHETIMYLLRELDPGLIDGKVDSEKLEAIVADLCKRAQEINSSGAAAAMHALLVAPAVAKRAGVESALAGMRAVLEAAGRGRPNLAFMNAYQPLLFLAQHRDELTSGLGMVEADVTAMVLPLLPLVTQVWRASAENPQIFCGFAIPLPTTPNSVLVHNWTFASLDFAKSLGDMTAMTVAINSAAKRPELEKAIAVARAVRVRAGDPELFDQDAIRLERREAFYAALGQRLVLLRDVMGDTRAEATRAMLDRCLRIGPDGLDAGLFLAALEWEVPIDRKSPSAIGYRERLLNNRSLRLSLTPLFDRVAKQGDVRSQDDASPAG